MVLFQVINHISGMVCFTVKDDLNISMIKKSLLPQKMVR
jgi:hypothetical protein